MWVYGEKEGKNPVCPNTEMYLYVLFALFLNEGVQKKILCSFVAGIYIARLGSLKINTKSRNTVRLSWLGPRSLTRTNTDLLLKDAFLFFKCFDYEKFKHINTEKVAQWKPTLPTLRFKNQLSAFCQIGFISISYLPASTFPFSVSLLNLLNVNVGILELYP